MMPDKQEGGSALHPSTVERLRRCIDAHPRILFGDQFPITRKFAEEDARAGTRIKGIIGS
jgi:hypothetical protein